MAAYYKLQGKTLINILDELSKEFGMFLHKVLSFSFEGAEGMAKMAKIMENLRDNLPIQIGGNKVKMYADYETGRMKNIDTDEVETIKLPKSNVLSYKMLGGTGVIVRPSGTEPKIKIYITACGHSREDAAAIAKALETDVKKILGIE